MKQIFALALFVLIIWLGLAIFLPSVFSIGAMISAI
jgi:hypothetical protein